VDNHEPEQMDDYSGSVAEMQTETSPGGVGSESQPTNFSGELERIRYKVREGHGTDHWYDSVTPNVSLAFFS